VSFVTSSNDTSTIDSFKQIPSSLDEQQRNDTIQNFNEIHSGIFTATVTLIVSAGNAFFVIIFL